MMVTTRPRGTSATNKKEPKQGNERQKKTQNGEQGQRRQLEKDGKERRREEKEGEEEEEEGGGGGEEEEEGHEEEEEEGGEEAGEAGGEEEEGEEEEGGRPTVTMLRKLWTNAAEEVYYSKLRVGDESYSCGDCVMMGIDVGGEDPAEILYIFKDKFGGQWVETRWLYTKEEIQERVPKSKLPSIEDVELFETNHVAANPATAIERKVAVLSEEDFRLKIKAGNLDEHRDFFCRSAFDTRLKRFYSVGDQRPALRLRRGRRFSDHSEAPGGRRSSGAGAGGDGGSKGPRDKFSMAMDRLHVTAVPKSLPCRTKERNILLSFLKSNIKSGGLGNALFVSGMPGSGKTATANEVMGVLRDEQAQGKLPSFHLVELNGMRLVNPHQAYTQLWMSLSGEMVPPKRALSKLDRYFSASDPSRHFVVLLVDELDYMTTAKQTVLYNLFEWPSRTHARLVVVGIANTVDLPERCMPRISSRLSSRLTFEPYKRPQLMEILQARLKETSSIEGNAFNGGAISMVAAKVASSTGDMRMCLKFCRRAVEVCKDRVETAKMEGRGDKVSSEVSVDDVHRAVRDITQQAHLLAVRHSAPQERLLLVAICNEVHLGGKGLVDMDDVRERMRGICRKHPNGPRMPNGSVLLEILARLGAADVLLLDLSRRTPMPDVLLNMSVRDVAHMLRDDEAFARKVLPEALTNDFPPTPSSSLRL
eukprot:jgi/Undpi1/2056/HiC_scaffold_12.g05442.m1